MKGPRSICVMTRTSDYGYSFKSNVLLDNQIVESHDNTEVFAVVIFELVFVLSLEPCAPLCTMEEAESLGGDLDGNNR